jgi:hypothetical protein
MAGTARPVPSINAAPARSLEGKVFISKKWSVPSSENAAWLLAAKERPTRGVMCHVAFHLAAFGRDGT